jgi:hypothetical protein
MGALSYTEIFFLIIIVGLPAAWLIGKAKKIIEKLIK